jgi:hypothetical protein
MRLGAWELQGGRRAARGAFLERVAAAGDPARAFHFISLAGFSFHSI